MKSPRNVVRCLIQIAFAGASNTGEQVRHWFNFTMLASVHSESRSDDALPVCLGASENPYRLVSLWDMIKAYGHALSTLASILLGDHLKTGHQ